MAELITRNPEIMHGSPCFAGTRVEVRTLFDNLTGGLSIDEIVKSYPSLKREQIIEVLDHACRRLAEEAPVVHT